MQENAYRGRIQHLLVVLISLFSVVLPAGLAIAATPDYGDDHEGIVADSEPLQSGDLGEPQSGQLSGEKIGKNALRLRGPMPRAVIGHISGPYQAYQHPSGTGMSLTESYSFHDMSNTAHGLGGYDIVRDGQKTRQWCVNLLQDWPAGVGTTKPVAAPMNHTNVPSDYKVNSNAEMAYILRTYGETGQLYGSPSNDPGVYAAVALLVHMNYELDEAVPILDDLIDTMRAGGSAANTIAEFAAAIASDARSKGASLAYSGGIEMEMNANRRDFAIGQVGLRMGSGNFEGGHDVIVTIQGPAVLDPNSAPGGTVSADGKTWTGKTLADKEIRLSGSATANGSVSARVSYPKVPQDDMLMLERPVGAQTTMMYRSGQTSIAKQTKFSEVVVDFQPMLTSSTDGAGSRIVDPGEKVLKDELEVFADPDLGDGKWLGIGRTMPGEDGYSPLSVKFKGTLYLVGEQPVKQAGIVPPSAKRIAETTLIAKGPGTYRTEVAYDGTPGFLTWVWEVVKEDQLQLSAEDRSMIHADWSDAYGLAAEQSSVRWPGKIESNLKVHPTNDNTFLVDDVWITQMPRAHGSFRGEAGFVTDTTTMEARLYFWEAKLANEVTSIDDATLVGTVEMDAKEGFFASQGSPDWKLQRDENGDPEIGTYQVVHVFDGDDRVAPFMSQVPDIHEMYEVTAEPQITTTATGEAEKMVGAFDKATITDEVCYLNLRAGKEYQLQGILMDQATGEPILVNGKEVRVEKVFVSEQAEGCENLEFEFDASVLGGTTTVVFEELYHDGIKVATHADIDDRGQSVDIPKVSTTATNGAEGKEIEAEPNQVVVDSVCYSRLAVGKTYQVRGVLMDKTKGEPLIVAKEIIESSKEFTAEKPDGCIELEFQFDASELANRELVVFEDLFFDGVRIATHADLEDQGQTVKVKAEELPDTGASVLGVVAAGVILAAAGLSLLLVVRRRRT
ncbi:VaFE repeat-containing surface-anchored protein [Actinomycetaceae bacterium MB13-C1-2]|nr:VaFE repeat-containing surface-anchored protein [Actinomycetaceae bacterium MB13-C1-2]